VKSMTDKWDTLTKKELITLLDPYSDDALICIGVNLQQGYVGFYDIEQDSETKPDDKFKFILKSKALDKWYKEDIKEAITMSKYVYEIWYEFYDGTMANNDGYTKKIKTYLDKEKAYAEKDRLNAEAQFPSEMPYSVREVKLDD